MRRIRIFNVFLSSTFADMQTERDYLRKKVFSVLDAELMKKGARLNVIDLRGSEKSGAGDRNLRVLYMCLEAVDNCRPRFIGLLGDRYGWIPYLTDEGEPGYDPAIHKSALDVVNQLDMDRNIHMIKEEMKGKSATHLEMHYALSPNNMGVEAPKLVRCEDCFFYERVLGNREEMPEADVAMFEDQRERQLLLKEDIQRRMAVEAPGHYRSYAATWDPREGRISASSLNTLFAKMLAQLRESIAQEMLATEEEPDAEQETSLFLMEKLERHLQQRPELARMQQLLSDETEVVALLQGVAGSGKSTLLAQLAAWLEPMAQQGTCRVLFHAAGLDPESRTEWGLLTHWNRLLESNADGAERTPGGLPPDAVDMPGAIATDIVTPPKGEQGLNRLRERFADLLFQVAAHQKVYLLLDSVDSMENTHTARHFGWMPRMLPPGTSLIASTLPGMACFPETFGRAGTGDVWGVDDEARFREDIRPQTIEIHGMSRQTVTKTLEEMALFQFGKSWNSQILDLSVDKCLEAGGLPLYAQILVGHLMTMTYEDFQSVGFGDAAHGTWMREQLAEMPDTIDALYAMVFGRIRQMDVTLCEAMDALLGTVAVTRRGLDQQTLVAAVADCTGMVLEDADLLSVQGLLRGHLRTAQQGWWDYEHPQVRRHLLGKETGVSRGLQKQYHASLIQVAMAGGEDVQYGAYFCTEFLWHAWLADMAEEAAVWLGTLPVSIEPEARQTFIEMLLEKEASASVGDRSALRWLERTMAALLHTPGFQRGTAFFARSLFDFRIMERVSYGDRIRMAEALSALWEQYQPEEPAQQRWKEENAAVLYRELGNLYASFDEREKAVGWLMRAEDLNRRLYEAQPAHPERMRQYAMTCHGLGRYLSDGGDLSHTETLYVKAEALFRQLRESNPESLELELHHMNLCTALGDLKIRMWRGHDKNAAQEWLHRAEEMCLPLLGKDPHNTMLMLLYADICTGLGNAHVDLEDRDSYVAWHEKAIAHMRELHHRDPGNPRVRKEYAAAVRALGISYKEVDEADSFDDGFDPDFVFVSKGEWGRAEQCFLKAEALYRPLCAQDPENPAFLGAYQYTCTLLGELYSDNRTKAEPWYVKAVEAAQVLHETHKENAAHTRLYADACHALALFHRYGDAAQVAKWFWKEAVARQLLCQRNPENLEGWEAYQELCKKIADHFEETEPTSAEGWYLKAEAVSRSLLALEPEDKERWWDHCYRCRRLGSFFEDQNEPDKAEHWYLKAEARCRAMCEKGMGYEETHADLCFSLGKLVQKHGTREDATKWLYAAERMRGRLLEADTQEAWQMQHYAEVCLALGRFHASHQERSLSEKWLLKAESLYLQRFEKNQNDGDRLGQYAEACIALGDFYFSGGDRENAEKWYLAAEFCARQLYEDDCAAPWDETDASGASVPWRVKLYADSCEALGAFYSSGDEPQTAEKWFAQAGKLQAECE